MLKLQQKGTRAAKHSEEHWFGSYFIKNTSQVKHGPRTGMYIHAQTRCSHQKHGSSPQCSILVVGLHSGSRYSPIRTQQHRRQRGRTARERTTKATSTRSRTSEAIQQAPQCSLYVAGVPAQCRRRTQPPGTLMLQAVRRMAAVHTAPPRSSQAQLQAVLCKQRSRYSPNSTQQHKSAPYMWLECRRSAGGGLNPRAPSCCRPLGAWLLSTLPRRGEARPNCKLCRSSWVRQVSCRVDARALALSSSNLWRLSSGDDPPCLAEGPCTLLRRLCRCCCGGRGGGPPAAELLPADCNTGSVGWGSNCCCCSRRDEASSGAGAAGTGPAGPNRGCSTAAW